MILCQITSQTIADDYAISITDGDFKTGSLRQSSNARPNRLFTADSNIILYKAGALIPDKVDEIIAKIVQIVRSWDWDLGAFVTLFDDAGRVLLARRRDYPVWNLPGGKVEQSETPWQAAVREVREETGLKVELERLTGVYCKPSRAAIVFNFQGRVVGGELTPTQESAELRYFDLHALPENTLPKQVERIHDSAARHAEVVFKVQDEPPGLEVLGVK